MRVDTGTGDLTLSVIERSREAAKYEKVPR